MRYDWLFGIAILGTTVVLWAYFILLTSYLKKHHHSVWISLGEPSVLNYSILTSGRLSRFLWGQPQGLTDLHLRSYVWIGRILQVIAISIIALTLLYLRQKGSA
jgi:hypothetical protein